MLGLISLKSSTRQRYVINHFILLHVFAYVVAANMDLRGLNLTYIAEDSSVGSMGSILK